MKHFQPKGQGPEMEPELPHEPGPHCLGLGDPAGQGPPLQGQTPAGGRVPGSFLSALFHKLLLKPKPNIGFGK